MNKIPLAQRLGQDAGTVAPVKLGFVQLRDFFSALEDLNADGYYSDVYYGIVREALENLPAVPDEHTMFDDPPPPGEVSDSVRFAEAVAMIMNLPKEERANLLYHIIIEPCT